DFELKEVYFIALMDFSFEKTSSDKYLHRVRLAEEKTGKTFYNKLGFIFLELPDFNLEEKEIKTDLERWMYVLRNMAKMEKIPVILHKKIFQKLFQIAETANLKKEEYMLYEKALLDKWTDYAVRKTAEKKGMEKGMEKGIAKGIAKGIEKGKQEVIGNLIIKMRLSDEQVADIVEMPVSFVKKIRASLKKKK
ncbi:MAG: PD-(D/E)XK nuclease family transposase, partial [Chitinophagaceae bacterium]|nr:PD-(D/E)XK nuclease family transposase [Chitinophagaceae bacterium]